MRKEVSGMLIGGVLAALLLAPAAAGAKTFNVHPGKNAIQRAVNKSDDGDTIRVHDGTYREDVVVDKQVRITDAGDGRPTINGRCKTQRVIDVVTGGVTLEGLRVKGAADEFTINMIVVTSGTVRNVVMRETCRGDDAALYGINVFDSGSLNLINNDAQGFEDAGIYVGHIVGPGAEPLLIKNNRVHGNNIGILVEFGDGGLPIVVRNNNASGNRHSGLSPRAGILLRGEDDVLVENNRADSNGKYGIHVDADSEDNVLNGNTAHNNPGGNLFNQGTNTCGSGNSFPLTPCM